MTESETVGVGFDGVLPGVVVVAVAVVPAVVFCISAVVVMPTEEALAVLVTAINDSVLSVALTLSSSLSSSSSQVA